jgi:KH/beta-lactamase-domain protein
MGLEDTINQVREEIEDEVPREVTITDIQFEAATLVIYTDSPDAFADDDQLVRRLAKRLQKRVIVRADPSCRAPTDDARESIEEIVPDDAQITDVHFEEETGEVIVEARKPGLVIGRRGSTLNEVKKEIGWAPKVVRTPPMSSKTIDDIRRYLLDNVDERKDFLRTVGRRINRGVSEEKEKWVRTTAVGGYREVGRSCHLLQTSESKVLIDCGVNPGGEEDDLSPYLHLPEVWPLTSLDAVVLTHAHLDHSGLVPSLYRYGYEGPVYTTGPTRDLSALLQLDAIKVGNMEGNPVPYESDHVREELLRTITLDYGDTTDIAPDIKLTLQNAGHILGSASAHFHVGEGMYNILFSGDIKYEDSWLYNAAENNFPRVETVVMEATYGGHDDHQPPRGQASSELANLARTTVERDGRLLVPVFAVGRSQEVMLVLEEHMRRGNIPEVPIYLDGMIKEATAIHTAYPEFLNNNLKNQILHEDENPLLSERFNQVSSHKMREEIVEDDEPCIMLATSGMMNGGPVREYVKGWADDPKSTLVFVGFQAAGTLGSKLQRGRREIPVRENGRRRMKKLEMQIETVDGFSGHSDRGQLIDYIGSMQPRPDQVLMNHGEESKCLELANTLRQKFDLRTRTPYNLETTRLK